MNLTLPAAIILSGLAFAASAQTNSAPAASPASFQKLATEIFSDQAEFDLKTNIVVYRGNVRVEEPKMKMTCELLTARLPNRGGHIESIVAEHRVVMDLIDERGQKIHGTGDRAVYTYTATATETNELVELTGNPMLETAQRTLTGDVITYDRVTGKLKATNQKMVVRMDTPGATNEVAATNLPAIAAPVESTLTTTNPPSEPAPANPQPSP